MTCRCILRAYCLDGAALASKAARAFDAYTRSDSFADRGKWLLAQRRLSKHVSEARAAADHGREVRRVRRQATRDRRAA